MVDLVYSPEKFLFFDILLLHYDINLRSSIFSVSSLDFAIDFSSVCESASGLFCGELLETYLNFFDSPYY